jgi:hypothetical protein
LVHVPLKQRFLKQLKNGYRHLIEVTAPEGEKVIPDAQDKSERHRIEEERLEPLLKPQRIWDTFSFKVRM